MTEKSSKEIMKITLAVIIVCILILLFVSLNNNNNKISYEITYNGLNCPTPYVTFNSDGTYEYYEHYGINENNPKPKTGKYTYDMNKLIKNVNNYEEDIRGPYTIKTSDGNEYTTYSSNKELRELLDNNGITLEKCMTSEDE